VHRTGDQLSSVEESRYMSRQIPGATMIELEGDDHFVSCYPDQILDAIKPFIAATPKPEHHMGLAAVVHASGPAAHELTAALAAAGGRLRHAASGDVVVLFDGPATGVRAAQAALETTPGARVGLSIAEVAVDGGPVSGPNVDEAIRLALDADAGELLVTRTAGVLLASAEVELRDREGASPNGAMRVHAFST
jgi:hypothetical protein